jgi:hypothetical protein
MSGRPCNPDSDFKRLWRAFMGDTSMPQCGVKPGPGETDGAEAAGKPVLAAKPAPSAKPASDRE